MRYTVDCFNESSNRYDTTTNPYEINEEHFVGDKFVIITDGIMHDSHRVDDWEDYEGYIIRIERSVWLSHNSDNSDDINREQEYAVDIQEPMNESMSIMGLSKDLPKYTANYVVENYNNDPNEIMDKVNPTHYKKFLDDYEWIDAMSRISRFKNPEKFKAALELQIRKYLDRLGGKDTEVQELKKARFYLQYLISYIENGCEPINALEVHHKIGE